MAELTWQITMLGPSRVGKTSLLTALQVGAEEFFAGTPISVEPVDDITAKAFRLNNERMLGELAARKFSPDSLPGDAEEHEYQLAVDPGVDDLEERQVLSFIDYPGGWISDGQHEERVRAHLADSPAVIVPIDATLIMESRPSHMADVARLLEMDAVKSHVRKWAKTRRREGDSTLLVLAPIKCETYFDDNGGRSDRSAVLLDHVRSLYHEVVDVYRKEAGEEAPLLYAPVDTVGPVAVADVEWFKDEKSGLVRMKPTYRVRTDSQGNSARRSVKGAEPILSYVVQDLVRLRDEAMHEERKQAEQEVRSLERERKKKSKWYNKWFDRLSGARDRRKEKTQAERQRIEQLDDGLRRLAANISEVKQGSDWSRVRTW